MKRWVSTLGSLVLLGACRMFVASDKHPPFRGAIRQPVWTVEGISAESIAAGEEVVLVMGAQSGETSKRLFALHAATGRRLWTSSFAPERVVAMGSETAFVLSAGQLHRRIELATGSDLNFSRDWTPWIFAMGAFYGFDGSRNVVAVDEEGGKLQEADTAFERPTQLAVDGDIVAALGRISGAAQQRLVVFDRTSLRLLWSAVFPISTEWVGRTDLVIGSGAVFLREYEIRVEGDTSKTHAFEARTGKDLWQRADNGETRAEDGLMGFDHGVLLLKRPYQGYTIASPISDMDRNGLALEPSPFFVTGIDPLTGKDLYTVSLYTRGHAAILASGGRLYTRDRKRYALIDEAGTATSASWLTSVDPATGAEVWRSKVQAETEFTAPTVAGDRMYVGGSPHRSNRGRAVVFAFALR